MNNCQRLLHNKRATLYVNKYFVVEMTEEERLVKIMRREREKERERERERQTDRQTDRQTGRQRQRQRQRDRERERGREKRCLLNGRSKKRSSSEGVLEAV